MIDVVAVYKFDRLSRSQIDFLQTLRLFENLGVEFVSATEPIDTTTPAGRALVSLLSTFAQFERKTISERTRDKMAATRRKGLWSGGHPPLGYDLVDKRLVVNTDEPERIREIFQLYIERGSLLAVVDTLKQRSWTTKTWVNKQGERVPGRPFNKSSLRRLLASPIYLGKMPYRDDVHDGAHDAIVDDGLWNAAQAQLQANTRQPQRPQRRKWDTALAGLVRCRCGAGWTHTWTRKKNKIYRYFSCERMQKDGAKACPGSRATAAELEAFVVDRIRAIGKDPDIIAATTDAARRDIEARRPELEAERRRLYRDRDRLNDELTNARSAPFPVLCDV